MLAIAQPCAAINIVLDYTYDSFFATHLTAKNTLTTAAQDLSNAITTSLGATSDTSSGTSGTATTTFDFSYSIQNPSNAATVTIDPAVLPANQIRIYVGVQNVTGSELGEGGPGGIGLNGSISYGNLNDAHSSVLAASAAGTANQGRGAGPVINRISGSFQNVANTSFTVNYGSTLGNIWFDVDSNNDGVIDSDPVLNSYWQFDKNSPMGPSQNDFYSVALHEMMHAIGFGESLSWNSLVSGSQNWLGSQVIALEGNGNNVVSTDGQHVAEGLLSTRLSDGGNQEAVMDPTLTTGTRKTLTRLDLAFLRDIGWQTVAFPLLPGDFNQDNLRTVADIQSMLAALSDLNGYRSTHGFSAAQLQTVGDLNGDGLVNDRDLQSLISLVASTTGGKGALQMVPEPGSLLLWVSGGGLCLVGAIHRRNGKRKLQREGVADGTGISMANRMAGTGGSGGC